MKPQLSVTPCGFFGKPEDIAERRFTLRRMLKVRYRSDDVVDGGKIERQLIAAGNCSYLVQNRIESI